MGPQEIGINLSGNSMYNYRYYVIKVDIYGEEGEESDGTDFICHQTDVEYGRYEYVENATIEHLEL